MVSVWVKNNAIIIDGKLVLSDGREFTLSDIPGNGFKASRLKKINKAIQDVLDTRLVIADMQADDPEKALALAGDDAYFLAKYGNRRTIDGSDLVDRSVTIRVEFLNGELVPFITEVI